MDIAVICWQSIPSIFFFFHILYSSYHRDTLCYFCWTLNERGHLVCKYQVMLPHAVMASCLNNLHALSVILVAILTFCLYNLCLCLPFYVLLFAILCSFAYLCFYLVYLCSWFDVLLVVCLLYHISYMCFISLTCIYHFVV